MIKNKHIKSICLILLKFIVDKQSIFGPFFVSDSLQFYEEMIADYFSVDIPMM